MAHRLRVHSASAEQGVVWVRLTAVAALVVLAYACTLSATDQAGWSRPKSWWGTASARATALDAIAKGDAYTAVSSAKVGLLRDPVSRPSVSVLGEALLLARALQPAARAYSLAVAGGWRDRAAQEWAVEAALSNGDWDQAAVHLDALLRGSLEEPMPTLWFTEIERHPGGRSALASRLSHSPDWARAWLRSSAQLSTEELGNRVKTIRMARSFGLSIPETGAAEAARRMIQRHPAQALSFWQAMAGLGDSVRDGVWDSVFKRGELSSSAGPFKWRKTDTTGVEFLYEESPQPHLNIAGIRPTSSTLLETHLALFPGEYTIHAAPVSLPAPVGFAIACAASTTAISHSGSSLTNSLRGFAFQVPTDCPLQRLSLVAGGTTAGQSGGSIGRLHISSSKGQ